MKSFLTTIIATLFFCTNTTTAQIVADNNTLSKAATIKTTDITSTDNNQSIFSDENNRVFFVDFEKINVNLNDIVVKNAANEVIFKEKVWDLPVNTIFELDMTAYKTGTYQIELHSFTGAILKSVVLK